MKYWLAILSLYSAVAFCPFAGYSADINNSSSSSNEVLQAMKRIIIPEIEFRQTPIKDVIDFLVKAALTNDPDKKGVNILILGSVETTYTNTEGQIQTRAATMSARYISLYNALKIATSVTELKFHIKNTAVVVMDQDDLDGEPIIMRIYPVDPTFCDHTRGSVSPSAVDVKMAFRSMGVSFPRGSSIHYNPGIGKLIVANTEENHLIIKNLLSELNVIPMQVQITAQFVSLESTNIPHASLGGTGNDVILGLCTNGTGRLIAAPTVIMRSGEESCIKGVTEIIYPTEFVPETQNNTNSAEILEKSIFPSSFATREVGVMLEVTPEITYGDTVNLVLKGQIVDDPVWKDYGRDMPTKDGLTRYVPMTQPFFHVNNFESKLTISDGCSALAFGGTPTRDGKGFVYCVITVRLVGTDGKPVRSDHKPFQSDISGCL